MPIVGKSDKNRDENVTEVEYVDKGLHSFQDISHICKFFRSILFFKFLEWLLL